jgi:Spy/CpxP family protein refolding chaperone
MFRKIFVLFNVMIFAFLLFSCGQDQPIRQRRSPAESAALLKEKLNLNDEQKDQIKQILENQQDKMMELRDSFSGNRMEMREAMRELRDETDVRIEEVLTDEQKIKYKEFKEERMQNMRERFRER